MTPSYLLVDSHSWQMFHFGVLNIIPIVVFAGALMDDSSVMPVLRWQERLFLHKVKFSFVVEEG